MKAKAMNGNAVPETFKIVANAPLNKFFEMPHLYTDVVKSTPEDLKYLQSIRNRSGDSDLCAWPSWGSTQVPVKDSVIIP